jgi:CDP-diacylglycerol---serine O-phosphatidyltransferase
MANMQGRGERPTGMRRAVVLFPGGLTLGNLFFGIYAMISASRGEFGRAVLFIVCGGVCDMLDGRVARATNSGSEFGEQLDSLVDAISFGLAPAMITYFAVLTPTEPGRDRWAWILVFFFCMCAVLRLARFNITQAGEKKSYFLGLPSPAAGGTLATYHWFAQTNLYQETRIGDLPWHELVKYLMIGLSLLMISNVRYPAFPRTGFRDWRGILGSMIVIGCFAGAIFLPREFFFPAGLTYVIVGLVGTTLQSLNDRPASLSDEEISDARAHAASDALTVVNANRRRKRRRSREDLPVVPKSTSLPPRPTTEQRTDPRE